MSIIKAWNPKLGRLENVRSTHNMLQMIELDHAHVNAGVTFSHSDKHTVASNGTLDHLIITNSEEVHLSTYDYASTAGPCDIFLYEAPFINVNSLGTEKFWQNRERNSLLVSSSQIYSQPFIDVNSIGDPIDYKIIESSAGGAIKIASGKSTGLSKWVLKTGTNYLIRFINNDSTNNADISVTHLMYSPGLE